MYFYNPVENADRAAQIVTDGRLQEPVVTPTTKIQSLFLSALVVPPVQLVEMEFTEPETTQENEPALVLEKKRYSGEICVVQGDIKGFTSMGEQATKIPVGKGILGNEGNVIIGQIIALREQGSNIMPIANATQQVLDEVDTARQLVDRAQSKGVKRVREVAEMMSRIHSEVLALNQARRSLGLNQIQVINDGVVKQIEESFRTGSEGDMLRYLCPDAEAGAEVALVYAQVLSGEIEERGLPLSFRISVTKLENDHIDVYTDPQTGRVWTSSGPGITKCSKAEEKTTPGRISLSNAVIESLPEVKFTNVGEGDVFEIDPNREANLLRTGEQRVRFERVNALPMPVCYCKLQIPASQYYALEDILPNLKGIAENYGLKWIKPNTTPEKDGFRYVSFICTAEGKSPMSDAVHALKRLGKDCRDVGWNGIFAVSYGPACLLTDDQGNIEDIITPTANRTARENAGQTMPDGNIVISLDPMAKTELALEGQTILPGTDFEVNAKGIEEPIQCTAYGFTEAIIQPKDVEIQIEEASLDSPISYHISELLYEALGDKGYNILDIKHVVETVLLYSGIKSVVDRGAEVLSIRRDGATLQEMDVQDQYKIRDLKYLSKIVLSFLDTFEAGKTPPVTNILNVLSLHVFHLEYIHDIMSDLTDEELHALTLLSTTSLGRIFPINFQTPFDAFEISDQILFSLKSKKLIYIVQSSDHIPQIIVRPGVSQLCDWACEPRLRESIHEEIVKLLLKRISSHTVPDAEWYKTTRILLLHAMNLDIENLTEAVEEDIVETSEVRVLYKAGMGDDAQKDAKAEADYRPKLIRIIKNALKFASDKKIYTDLIMFSEAFLPLYKTNTVWRLQTKLQYGFSHLSMNNIDEAISVFKDIDDEIKGSNIVLDPMEQGELERVKIKAQLYNTIAVLKRNHLFIRTREEMVAQLRSKFMGNPMLGDDQIMIYEFLRINGGLTRNEKIQYRQLISETQFI